MKRLLATIALGLMWLPLSTAQEKKPELVNGGPIATVAPALTSEQKLLLQNKFQAIEIAKLRFDAAQSDLNAFMKTLEKEGWILDLSTLTYKKAEKPK